MGVANSVKFIMDGNVRPEMSDETREARRKGPKSSGEAKTLIDTGVGARQIAFEVDVGSTSVFIGVPDGYMAYHQEGRVPNAPKREFLQLPTDSEIEKTIKHYLEK